MHSITLEDGKTNELIIHSHGQTIGQFNIDDLVQLLNNCSRTIEKLQHVETTEKVRYSVLFG